MSYRVSKPRAFGGETAVSVLLIVWRHMPTYRLIHKYTEECCSIKYFKVNYVVTYFITILQYYPIKTKSTQTTA